MKIFFNNWFVQNLIIRHKHFLNTGLENDLNEILKINQKAKRLKITKAFKIWQNKRDILLNNLTENSTGIKKIFSQVYTI